MAKAAFIIVATLGALGVVVLGAILNGYVLSVLWGWFMVPIFALPPLGVVPAMGLALLASMLAKDPNATTDGSGWRLANAILSPIAALGIGWAIAQFM